MLPIHQVIKKTEIEVNNISRHPGNQLVVQPHKTYKQPTYWGHNGIARIMKQKMDRCCFQQKTAQNTEVSGQRFETLTNTPYMQAVKSPLLSQQCRGSKSPLFFSPAPLKQILLRFRLVQYKHLSFRLFSIRGTTGRFSREVHGTRMKESWMKLRGQSSQVLGNKSRILPIALLSWEVAV